MFLLLIMHNSSQSITTSRTVEAVVLCCVVQWCCCGLLNALVLVVVLVSPWLPEVHPVSGMGVALARPAGVLVVLVKRFVLAVPGGAEFLGGMRQLSLVLLLP